MFKNMTVTEACRKVSKLQVTEFGMGSDILGEPGPHSETLIAAMKLRKVTQEAYDIGFINDPPGKVIDFHTGLETGLLMGYFMFSSEVEKEK